MGINETRDQELSFRQVQLLEFSAVANVCQERFFRCRRIARWCDLMDGLDQTIVTDVDECVGEGFIGTLVGG